MALGGTEASYNMFFPQLFNIFFAAILFVTLDRFDQDAARLADVAHLQEQYSKVSLNRHWNVHRVLFRG